MLGLLLVNLGSPKSPDPNDVKEYLHEFLNDPYVIDLPAPLRYLLVNGIILRTRPKKSAEAYASIWGPRGSPLLDYTAKLTQKVQARLSIPVEMGMRYGCPCMDSAITRLLHRGATHVVMLPLYPQYSYAASETAIVEFESIMKKRHPNVGRNVIEDFYRHPAFIEALVQSIEPTLNKMNPDTLLLSYHGIPNQQRFKTRNKKDYREHCYHTTKSIQDHVKFPPDRIQTSFQSRLGPTKWIEPYTDFVLPELVQKGVKKLAIASPSFTADCLETLEEINIRYRADFLAAGGENFEYIPCLNDSDKFADAIVRIVKDHCPPTKSI